MNLLRPIEGLEKVVLATFVIRFLVILLSTALAFMTWQFWPRFYGGEFTEETSWIVTDAFKYIGHLNSASFVLLNIVYSFWIYRAYQNLERIQLKGLTYSATTAALWTSGLALLHWLPFYNFWMYFLLLYFIVPFLVVRELYRGSNVIHGKQAPHGWHFGRYNQLIIWWWIIWIAARIIEAVAPEFRHSDGFGGHADLLLFLSLALDLFGTFLWLVVMRKITQMQTQPSQQFLEDLAGTISPGPGYEDQISRPGENTSQEEPQSE